jgi:integrase
MSYHRVADGIYRDSRTGHFYERPTVRGRRTWRKLDGHLLKLARESLAQRRADTTRSKLGLARDPYAPAPLTLGAVLDLYREAHCPDRHQQPRDQHRLVQEESRIRKLLPFWQNHKPEHVRPALDFPRYLAHRTFRKGAHGGRAVDLELATLANACRWAVMVGKLQSSPFVGPRPKFRSRQIQHCRDAAPLDAGELHSLAAYLFERTERVVLGWQLLLEAFTGCRTSEILALRWDAQRAGDPGFQDGAWLWLRRCKGGVNPFALIHPALRALLDALAVWRRDLCPKTPWYCPSPRDARRPVDRSGLAHALRHAGPAVLGRRITSHGMRSFYVTVRRSQGVTDAQIAAEIGDSTGASLIASTYGSVPPNWRAEAPLAWLPATHPAAWHTIPHTTRHTKSGMSHAVPSGLPTARKAPS